MNADNQHHNAANMITLTSQKVNRSISYNVPLTAFAWSCLSDHIGVWQSLQDKETSASTRAISGSNEVSATGGDT